MRQTTVERTSFFPAPAGAVWALLGRIDTLQYIARPYAAFAPVDGRADWQAGHTYRLTLRLFGVAPLGIHQVQVLRWDKASFSILTNEGNAFVPLWNHEIRLVPCAGGCYYTDRVTLGAGWKTPFVGLWARCFYRHRQKKWLRLLQSRA